MKVTFITLFPETVLTAVRHSMLKRAEEAGIVAFDAVNPRDFATDPHRTVDDQPYGGGAGMVMKADVVGAAIASIVEGDALASQSGGAGGRLAKASPSTPESEAVNSLNTRGVEGSGAPTNAVEGESLNTARVEADGSPSLEFGVSSLKPESTLNSKLQTPYSSIVFTDPAGSLFTQNTARELAAKEHVVFLCGHYEGIDERLAERYATHRLSIGDYVLTGGELPAAVMADAIVRLLPGVLGAPESLEQDAFSDGMLTYPQYTRPPEWEGMSVPDVLLSGNHEAVAAWRRKMTLELTRRNRPDLFAKAPLSKADLKLLQLLSPGDITDV